MTANEELRVVEVQFVKSEKYCFRIRSREIDLLASEGRMA